jgi:D-lactate dehydrogenase
MPAPAGMADLTTPPITKTRAGDSMADSEKLALLGKIELFDQLKPETLREIADLAEPRVVADGEFLFCEGDPNGFLFLIVEGALEVRKRSDEGTDVVLRVMSPGEVGGLTSTTVDRPRSATLRARRQTRVFTIDREEFLRLLQQRSDLVHSVLTFLGGRVRDKTARLASLMARDQATGGEAVAIFDAKPYDRRFFDAQVGDDLSLQYLETRLTPETASLAAGFRVVCAFVNDDLGQATLERLAAGGVELIALRCAGFNNVDLEAAKRHQLTVLRVPGYSPHSVAEHTIALILALNRKTHRAYHRVREGNFSLSGLVGFDLYGRTAGIVGLGKIGRVLAGKLVGLGMHVVGHDPYTNRQWAAESGIKLLELNELLARSDIINLTAPLTPETRHMIDTRAIDQMKQGVMLINTGRGALVDTAALIEGLKSRRIGAAGLDVYEEEGDYFFEDRSDQVITDDVLARLLTFPNVLITSHQAFLTEDALRDIARTTLGNIRSFLKGRRAEELENVVLPQV